MARSGRPKAKLVLTEDERALLARLAVFAGGFSLELAESVASLGPETDTLIVVAPLNREAIVAGAESAGTDVKVIVETVPAAG